MAVSYRNTGIEETFRGDFDRIKGILNLQSFDFETQYRSAFEWNNMNQAVFQQIIFDIVRKR